MRIITLTTDFGTRDFYAGALKGAILRQCPGAQLIDISHRITPYDIVEGALVLKHSWQEFPEGTIHLVAVHCVYDPKYRFVAARKNGHIFLAPDNGLLTLVEPHWPAADLRILPFVSGRHFAVKDCFSDAAAHLYSGAPWELLGLPAEKLVERVSIQPVLMRDRIRGTVIHIDNFDNAVVNINRDDFDRIAKGRSFSLHFRRHDPITKLSTDYCDVPVGELLCLFNSAGLLEIAVNLGRASTLFGLRVEEVVEIVFNTD